VSSSEEIVSLVARDGSVTGSAPRWRVRRENLLHGATAVLVRRSDGRIFVHRRSAEKDWSPSFHDAAAGGVLQHLEDPAESALRELAEELGIRDVELASLGDALYEDETVRCFERCFETTYDGEVTYADGEVVWGDWMSLEDLGARLADPDWPFVPDTRALLESLSARGVRDYARLGLHRHRAEGDAR